MADRTVKGAGFKLIFSTGTVSDKLAVAIREGLNKAGLQYLEAVKKNISLSDHTLEDLRELGYPYASRHGAKSAVHSDDRLVHTQSGELLDSIELIPAKQTSSRSFTVYVQSDDPVLPFLLYGTSKMRPRRFHEKALQDLGQNVFEPVTDALKNVKHRITETPG